MVRSRQSAPRAVSLAGLQCRRQEDFHPCAKATERDSLLANTTFKTNTSETYLVDSQLNSLANTNVLSMTVPYACEMISLEAEWTISQPVRRDGLPLSSTLGMQLDLG